MLCTAAAAAHVVSSPLLAAVGIWYMLIFSDVMTTPVTKWAKGHTDSIICLAHNGDSLASGGEDNQICLWSNEVKIQSKLNLQDEVTSIHFKLSNPNILYAASGNKLNLIDVRDFNHVQTCKEFNSEEINEVIINSKETFIATCDDSGDVKVVDLREMRLFKTLQRHKNICSSVKFHPTKGCELVSAGLDCIVNSWDFMKGRNLGSFNMHECPSGEDDSIPAGTYMVNPPLVHSIDISGDGSKVMCGLENGKVQVIELGGRGRFEPLCALNGHSRGVSKVKILQCGSKEMIISGGNDGTVILWENNEEKRTPHNRKREAKGKKRGENLEESDGARGGVVDPTTSAYSHRIVTVIEHGSKVNCLLAAMVVESKTHVYVADQTESVSLYDISKTTRV